MNTTKEKEKKDEDEDPKCPKCGAKLEFYANGEQCSKCDHKYIYGF